MANTKLIDALNRALSLELAGVIQYLQHSFLVTGPEREVYREFFRKQSEEAHEHATRSATRSSRWAACRPWSRR